MCSADGLGTQCSASVAKPQKEICDGIDNDCDGEIWVTRGMCHTSPQELKSAPQNQSIDFAGNFLSTKVSQNKRVRRLFDPFFYLTTELAPQNAGRLTFWEYLV